MLMLEKLHSSSGQSEIDIHRDVVGDYAKLGWNKWKPSYFYSDRIEEIINIQEQNGKSKQYQIKQIREIILKYKLEVSKDEKY